MYIGDAEMMYDSNKNNSATTINLEAFDVIKIIGKGTELDTTIKILCILLYTVIYCYPLYSHYTIYTVGSFGKVFLVRFKELNTLHAMKQLVKEDVLEKKQVEQTRVERSVLQR
jgi:hypothetical protein